MLNIQYIIFSHKKVILELNVAHVLFMKTFFGTLFFFNLAYFEILKVCFFLNCKILAVKLGFGS